MMGPVTFSGLDSYFPIGQIFREIEARLGNLAVCVSIDELRHHVLQYEAEETSQAIDFRSRVSLATELYSQGKLGRANWRHVHHGLSVLELATLACERARARRPKNLRALLEEALALLQQFDALEILLEKRKVAAIAARVRGGIARQAKLEPARRRAARLLLVKAPRTGWVSAPDAARTIEPFVAAFVKRRRMSMVGVHRTIVKWIDCHPSVRAAYNKRRPPAAP